jgi:predicted amidohydrolase YtcJ
MEATLVVRNGKVYTVDEEQPWAEAIAIDNDRIVFVGSDEGADEFVGSKTETIDAKGGMVLPGLIDAHVHCMLAHQAFFWADLADVETLEQALETMKAHALEHPEHSLVGGHGFYYSALTVDDKLPSKHELDTVDSKRPVWLISYDGWTGIANSTLLEIITDAMGDEFQELEGVEKDSRTGEPTGVFYRTDDLDSRVDVLSSLTRSELRHGLIAFTDLAAKWGITSVHEALARNLGELELLDDLRKESALKTRIYVAMAYSKHNAEERLKMFEVAKSRYNDDWIRVGAVKFFMDGVAESHTAAMLEPYCDRPSYAGDPFYTQEEFNGIVKTINEADLQCMTHASGDRAVRVALNAYEEASLSRSARNRHRIEHVECASSEDVARFGPLGVIASMQPMHAAMSSPSEDDIYHRALGEERIKRSYPMKSLISSGAVLAFSSDWSVVDINPFLGIQAAMMRVGTTAEEDSITLEEAIRGYTINAAYASFEEHLKGSLERGKLADIVVLSHNLFEMAVDQIDDVRPVTTIVGGKVVYAADS